MTGFGRLAWLGMLFRRGGAAPPRDAADWQRIHNYSALYRLIPKGRFRNRRAFLDGPLERYLQLVEATPGAAGARIMEHARASISWLRDREVAAGRPVDLFDAEVDALVRVRFGSGSENDAYMIEVFEGRATHHYRASDEMDED